MAGKKKLTLVEALNKASNQHRYYLHRRVKQFFKLSAHKKTLYVSVSNSDSFTKKQKQYIEDLRRNYGYSVQTEIS